MPVMKLTDRNCASAKGEPGKRIELYDALVTGLALRITPKGTKSWVYRYRTSEKQTRLALGTFPNTSLEKARAKARTLASTVEDGGDPAADKLRAQAERKADPIKTFNDLADAYLAACGSGEWKPMKKVKRPRTLDDETNILRRNVRPHIGGLRPEDVTKAHVKTLLRKMTAQGITSQANRTHAVVRQVYNFALKEDVGKVVMNPALHIDPPAVEKPRARTWTDDELKALWTGLEDPGTLAEAGVTRPVAIALQLVALTLQRRGEVAGMMRSEVDLTQKTWLLPSERTKNGKPHLVPLSPRAVTLIEEALGLLGDTGDKDVPIFASRAGKRTKAILSNSVSHAYRDVRPLIGMKGENLPTVHDLRRTGATLMTSERLSISPMIRSKVLNHTDAGGGAMVSMAVYDTNTYVAEKRRALDAWAALLLEIVGERPRPDNVHQLRDAANG